MSLSTRGRAAADQPLRADLDAFFAAQEDLYHPTDNPDGKFTLTIAENGLLWPELQTKMEDILRREPTPEWTRSYTAITGAPDFRAAVAGFLERHVAGVPLDPERLAITAGAASVIEQTAWLAADAGDVAVLPGPAYMAYTPDLRNRARVDRYDLHPAATADDPRRALLTTDYQLTVADLERAHADLGDRFRMLILTQPNNPTGQVYTHAQLTAFADWCTEREIHLAVNEIYATSLLEETGERFVSFLPLLEERRSPYLHWWYSFSKDFGISGFRLGVYYSHNERLLQAWGNIGSTNMASNHSQWLLGEVLNDDAWVRDYLAENRRRLTASFRTVTTVLDRHELAYAPAAGSLFVWCDLSRFLTAATDAAEQALWQRVFDETGILLTAPAGQGSPVRGWFRLVYSCVSAADLRAAMDRLDAWLGTQPPA